MEYIKTKLKNKDYIKTNSSVLAIFHLFFFFPIQYTLCRLFNIVYYWIKLVNRFY